MNRLVMEVNQGCPRGFAFTLLQSQINSESGETEQVPIDLTNYTVQFRVKAAPYYKLENLIQKDITTTSDSQTVGVITNPTDGEFQVQLTMEDTLKLPPAEYALCIYLNNNGYMTNISGEGNRYAIFRVCTM